MENTTQTQAISFEHYPRPIVMVDIVMFTIIQEMLQVLLVKRGIPPFQRQWALPGGAVRIDIDHRLEDAAMRELREETGVTHHYLEQMYTYGGSRRDPRGWSVSVAYFALIPPHATQAGSDASEACWYPVSQNSVEFELAFDHGQILQDALVRLRAKLDYTDLAVHLLAEEFTLGELQRVYEIIMQEKLNKSSFRQRVDRAGIVEPIEGKMRTGSNRPAQLYRFVKAQGQRVFFPRSLVWAERKS